MFDFRRLFSNNSALLSAQIIVVVCGVFSQYILSNNMEISSYGLLILIIDLCLTFSILIDFGLPTWGLRNWDGREESAIPHMAQVMRIQIPIASFLIPIMAIISILFLPRSDIFYVMGIMISVSFISISEPL